jgi:glycosyltransferase involved in cell wall biosynthesis
MEQVVRQRPDARLLLVGEGPERGKIEDEIRQRGVEANVRLLGQRGDVARMLRAADLFLLTSISEGIPLTVIEAMAAALPVVATNVGGMTEVVEDEQTALLAPAGDAAGLAAGVVRLAGDPELRRQMGQRGRERAHGVFSESQMHAQYVRLYDEMLSA